MAQFQSGSVVPFSLQPGIVMASILTSLVGAVTTVELLHRRSPGPGWTSWFQLGSCAGTMGIVAIWCMHCIGNRAIVLGDGAWDLQLVYDPTRTALSCLIPVATCFVAFVMADRAHRRRKNVVPSLIVAGLIMGLPIVGMHYLGDSGVSNYQVKFDASYVGGAVVLAMVACVSALTLTFAFRELRPNKLVWRILFATLIAGAATGIHFEASMGTTYVLKHHKQSQSVYGDINVIIATFLSLCTIPICIGIAVSANRRHKHHTDRAKEAILASATFDHDGRLLVTHEGYLPMQKIDAKHSQLSFEDEFNTSHPTFQWIYRVSHNWESVLRWIPQMRKYLKNVVWMSEEPLRLAKSNNSIELVGSSDVADAEYSMILRASFCVAATNLAQLLGCPLNQLGTLHDGVLITGSVDTTKKGQRFSSYNKSRRLSISNQSANEANFGDDLIGNGQLLLVVRKMSKTDMPHLMAQGYHFVTTDRIGEQLAHGMQVSASYLTHHLETVKANVLRERVPGLTGTLLGCFAVRAGVSKKHWEVLVRKDLTSRLPCVQLSSRILDTATWALIAEFEGLSVADCLARLHKKLECPNKVEQPFLADFRNRIALLSKLVSEPFFHDAIFSSSPVEVTSYDRGLGRSVDCDLFAFYIIPDVHVSELKSSTELVYTPLSFFKCLQQQLGGAAYRTSFERRVHQELASFFLEQGFIKSRSTAVRKLSVSAKSASSQVSEYVTRVSKAGFRRSGLVGWAPSMFKDELEGSDSLEHDPLGGEGEDVRFGGIMVTTDVTVETTLTPLFDDESSLGVDEGGVGTCSHADVAKVERPTYVDKLFEITTAKWRKR